MASRLYELPVVDWDGTAQLGPNLIARLNDFRGKRTLFAGREVLFELLDAAGPQEHTIGWRVMQQPAEGDVDQGSTHALSGPFQFVHGDEIPGMPVSVLIHGVVVKTSARWNRGLEGVCRSEVHRPAGCRI